MTPCRCGQHATTGDRLLCEVGESEYGNLRDGLTYEVTAVSETEKGATRFTLAGLTGEHGAWRFRKAAAWQRPDTRDLDPSEAEIARFEAARERATKATKTQRGFTR